MTRNKWAVLGLSALALLAMSAFVVNGAQAESENPEFTCLENHIEHVACTAHGEEAKMHRERNEEFSEDHYFEAGLAKLTCKTVTFEVTTDADGTIPTPQVHPTYEECEDTIANNPAHVNMNGCYYEFHPEETSGETKAEDEYTGTATLKCPPEKTVTIDVTNASKETKCHIELHEQDIKGSIYFRTMTGADPTDVTVEAFGAEATATFHVGGFFGCGVIGTEATTKYTGNTTVQALDDPPTKVIDLELD